MSDPNPNDRYADQLQEHTGPLEDGADFVVQPQSIANRLLKLPWRAFQALIRLIVRDEVPSWARAATPPQIHTAGGDLPTLPEDGDTYVLQGRDPVGASPPIRFWTHLGGRSLAVSATSDIGDSGPAGTRGSRSRTAAQLRLTCSFTGGGLLELTQAVQG